MAQMGQPRSIALNAKRIVPMWPSLSLQAFILRPDHLGLLKNYIPTDSARAYQIILLTRRFVYCHFRQEAGGYLFDGPSLLRMDPSGQAPRRQLSRFNLEATNFASYRAFSMDRKLHLRAVALILALFRESAIALATPARHFQ